VIDPSCEKFVTGLTIGPSWMAFTRSRDNMLTAKIERTRLGSHKLYNFNFFLSRPNPRDSTRLGKVVSLEIGANCNHCGALICIPYFQEKGPYRSIVSCDPRWYSTRGVEAVVDVM